MEPWENTPFFSYIALNASSLYRVYRPGAGRQLLIDYRHMYKWLISSNQRLQHDTTQFLSTLPVLTEMEHGLLMICGTAEPLEPPKENTVLLCSLIPGTPYLPIFKELAWHTDHIWSQCISKF